MPTFAGLGSTGSIRRRIKARCCATTPNGTTSPRRLPALCEAFLRACQIACTAPKGPTYVCLDAGLQETRCRDHSNFRIRRGFVRARLRRHPQDTLEEMARLLIAAEPPAHSGRPRVAQEDDWDRRVRLAEALGAKVISELRAAPSFPTEHPLHVYPPRYTPNKDTLDLMRSADVILALDSFDLGGWFKLMKRAGRAQGEPSSIAASTAMFTTAGARTIWRCRPWTCACWPSPMPPFVCCCR